MERLAGKVAIVTGAASGMGVTHVELLVAAGARVVIADVADESGAELAARLGDRVVYRHLDVTSEQSWAEAVAATEQLWGPVTVLVNNAGVSGGSATTIDMDMAAYEKTIAVDQHGTLYGMRAVIPGMIEAGGGSIINISSVAGIVAAPGFPNVAYVAAKFAVRGMTKAAAVEFAEQGVRVNSIHPGTVKTPLTEELLVTYGEEFRREYLKNIPVRRLAEPEEISHAVVFLASDEASFMTGTEIILDGGQTAT